MIMSMMITSSRKWEYEGYLIQKWKYAGLDHESTLMYKKVYPIPEDDFIKRIGTLHPSDIWNLNCLWKNMSASQSKEFPKGPDVESD